MADRPLVWLLSAYRADSHAAWADWLVANLRQVEWRQLDLPGRHFAWRIRGNPLSWLDRLPDEQPDLLLATSMVDLATLKGLHPRLAPVPAFYYFHENQYAYPPGKNQLRSLEPRMVQLYGGLSADRLLFNSAFNRDSYLQGVEALLKKMPDAVPPGVAGRLADKCAVYPVAIEPVPPAVDRDPRLVLWNHRWEHDKAPGLFAETMIALAAEGVPFRLALLGKRPRRVPAPLARLRQALPERIVADGMLPREDYLAVLGRAGIAVSTARHEFQGLSMLEAASAGARPLVPDDLCYPDQYASRYRYPAGDGVALRGRLRHWLSGGVPPAVDVSPWYGERLAPVWQALLKEGCKLGNGYPVPVPTRNGVLQ